jgi:nucleoside-diphosphate-sugar epimerase
MRVLVTGSGGFTGRPLIDALRLRGDEPLSLQADLRDAEAIAEEIPAIRPDRVIHLAALAFVASSDFDAFYAVNQVGTFNLLEALARHAPGIPVLLASSAQAYSPDQSGLINEDAPLRPSNHYGLSKLAMEMGANFWSDQLRIIITRPFNYTGVGQEKRYLIPKIVDHFVRRAAVIELGNIDIQRDFGDVRSVCEAYASLVATPDARGIFNVSTGKLSSIRDIIATLSSMVGHDIEIAVNPAFVRQNDIAVLGGDNSKLRMTLPDWSPRTLADTLQWMLTQTK